MRNSAMTPAIPIRIFMIVEVACFVVAVLVHAGALFAGYEHREARIAESVLAIVLFVGLALIWIRPEWTRRVGIATQGFALLGTLVGVFTIVVGVGPQTAPDIIYHIGIVAVLIWGVVVAIRAPANDTRQYA